MRHALFLLAAGLLLVTRPATTQSLRPIALDDYLAIKSVSGLAVSPDGRYAAYLVREVDVPGDTRDASLWRVPVAGGPPERLTHSSYFRDDDEEETDVEYATVPGPPVQ